MGLCGRDFAEGKSKRVTFEMEFHCLCDDGRTTFLPINLNIEVFGIIRLRRLRNLGWQAGDGKEAW